MGSSIPPHGADFATIAVLLERGVPAIARYEIELAIYRAEASRLRAALAQADALLVKKEHVADPAAAWPDFLRHQADAAGMAALLTPRQHEIMALVLAGHPSKNIAADLQISQRTVENHRAAIMRKTGSKSLPALARFGLVAAWTIPAPASASHDPL